MVALGVLLTAALITGVFYERAQRAEFLRKVPPIGATVDIGERKLNFYCAGEGSPTVILEPPLGLPGLSWSALLPKVSPFTKACWFDRAGTGWSDPGPFPRTGEAIAQDLHALLVAAEIPGPYLLVGPRFGAHALYIFRDLYPAQVADLIFVDSPTGETTTPPEYLVYPMNVLVQVLARTSLLRFIDYPALSQPLPSALTSTQQDRVQALARQPEARAAEWSAETMRGNDQEGQPATQDLSFDEPRAIAGAIAERVEQFRAKAKATADPRSPERSPGGASGSPHQLPPARKHPKPPGLPPPGQKPSTVRPGAQRGQA